MRAAPKAARKTSGEVYVYSQKHEIERLLYQNGAFFSGLLVLWRWYSEIKKRT